jgi:hypothetical protein
MVQPYRSYQPRSLCPIPWDSNVHIKMKSSRENWPAPHFSCLLPRPHLPLIHLQSSTFNPLLQVLINTLKPFVAFSLRANALGIAGKPESSSSCRSAVLQGVILDSSKRKICIPIKRPKGRLPLELKTSGAFPGLVRCELGMVDQAFGERDIR